MLEDMEVGRCENWKISKSAMDIYQITKSFPTDEKYSLVDQIRRSARTVCSCIAVRDFFRF
jgi:four helix bundle protein